MINVSWDDAWAYADWLTERTGEEYRLLSEAEWEYVARAGTETARYWGESAQQQCQYANGYDAVGHAEHGFDRNPVGCQDRQANTAPVGSYRPNAFGLYDVLGNVFEWVDDCWNDSYEGAPTDGSPRYTGDCSLVCCAAAPGAASPGILRSAFRGRELPRVPEHASTGSVWPGPSIDPRILTSLPPSRGSRGQRPLAADSSS